MNLGMQPVLLITNCDSAAEAELIADTIIESGLAAAVQTLGPVNSRYRWNGQTYKKPEWMVMIKTCKERLEDIRQALTQLHSYELPGLLCLNIDDGESGYLEWILKESTRPTAGE